MIMPTCGSWIWLSRGVSMRGCATKLINRAAAAFQARIQINYVLFV